MSRANNIVLIIELLLIGSTSFALLSAAAFMALTQLLNGLNFVSMVFGTLTLLSTYAVVSVNWLVISYLSNDKILCKKYIYYWIGVLVGCIVLVVSIMSHFPSYSEPYKREWLYSQITLFVFGAPLLIPVVHVLTSALVNQYANKQRNTDSGADAPTPVR
ncbi:MAG: hypothetical protein KZQ77_09465 [Candidatus Thiodiazotropha sp. (ex Notomyrtea botanica)]|nr:hypothetical protein [Candidatus Thiodiazotropha sp. (ex Notomyrtea botanica)]